jgi:hypothetical protein
VADQETLPVQTAAFNPAVHGLWKRFVDEHHINHGAWLRACAEGAWVGTCRHCGDYLIPRQPQQIGERWDYEAHCRSPVRESHVDGRRVVTGCGQILCAPGGRLGKPKRSRTGT